MLLDVDFTSITDALKNVFSIGVVFFKAIWVLFLKLWDLLLVVINFIRGLIGK